MIFFESGRDHTQKILWLFFLASIAVSAYVHRANDSDGSARSLGEIFGGALTLFVVPFLIVIIGRWRKKSRKELSGGRIVFAAIWFAAFSYFAIVGAGLP